MSGRVGNWLVGPALRRILIPAEMMANTSGTATKTTVGGTRARPVWSLPDSASTALGCHILLPWSGNTDVTLYLVNLSAAAGDVGMILRWSSLDDTTDLSGNQTIGPNTVATCAAQSVVFTVSPSPTFKALDVPQVGTLTIERQGAVAGDTVAGAVGVLAVALSMP